jgi:uncharacterized protein
MSIKIACLSDTHGFFDKRLSDFLSACDEIWHAGDIGSMAVADQLVSLKPLRAVCGNIDDHEMCRKFSEHQRFMCEGVDVWITHIGGYPGNYHPSVKKEILRSPPQLFVCGHPHILKIMNDKNTGLLHVNPGAAGLAGMHRVQTAVRFVIDNNDIADLEIIELEREVKKLF